MTYEQLKQLSFPDLLSLLECTIKHAQEYAKGRDWSPGAATMMPPPALLEIGDFEIRARFPNVALEGPDHIVTMAEHNQLRADCIELLSAAERMVIGETLHQTALRYIREAELFMSNPPAPGQESGLTGP
jgi:hypothetical protein